MRVIHPKDFTADRAWGALDVASLDDATVRLQWPDQPYEWHDKDGTEDFVVLDGVVDMRFRKDGEESTFRLERGDVCLAELGDEHVAHPVGLARILVIEKRGSA